MASAFSSSGSVPNALRKYDVFIIFRGEIRNNFASHLYAALNRAFLEVFRDDKKLENGDEIALSLSQAIKDSSVSVIVFSEDYASSKWCLDELEQIMQYKKDVGQFVIPIFYKVEPRDVRKQTGPYKEAFEKHEKNYQHDPDRVKRWRASLFEAGNLICPPCETSTDESKLLEEIVADVSAKLECIYNCQGTSKDVIGIDEMIEPIEELLNKSHKVGIWGMGGAGKTTMAKVVFDNLSSQYNHRWFLENVREETEKKGLKHVPLAATFFNPTGYCRALCLVETRFPISSDPDHVNTLRFVWFDAFKPKLKATQQNIHLEKSAVLFNLGAVYSQIGLSYDRNAVDGLRQFIAAAGSFAYLRNNATVKASIGRSTTVDLFSILTSLG